MNDAQTASQSHADELFERFWFRYPRQDGELKTRAAWSRLKINDAEAAALDTALSKALQCTTWTTQNGMFIPPASAWLARQMDAGGCLNRRRPTLRVETQFRSEHREARNTLASKPPAPHQHSAGYPIPSCASGHESASQPPVGRPAQSAFRRFEFSLSSGVPEKEDERCTRASLDAAVLRAALALLLDVLKRVDLPDESTRTTERECQRALYAARLAATGPLEGKA